MVNIYESVEASLEFALLLKTFPNVRLFFSFVALLAILILIRLLQASIYVCWTRLWCRKSRTSEVPKSERLYWNQNRENSCIESCCLCLPRICCANCIFMYNKYVRTERPTETILPEGENGKQKTVYVVLYLYIALRKRRDELETIEKKTIPHALRKAIKYNDFPATLMQAIFAKALDKCYADPNPAKMDRLFLFIVNYNLF
ncbi:MAG: hypothetical protein MHMPM18_000294 [Marteilia pararefringens]